MSACFFVCIVICYLCISAGVSLFSSFIFHDSLPEVNDGEAGVL
jgi:hypothetical protein